MAQNTSVDASPPKSVEVCPDCGGSGWKPVPADGARRVERCQCRLRTRVERLLENARIPRRYQSCFLENYKTNPSHPSLAYAKAKAVSFVEQYPLDKTGLIFVGRSGAGKTHLAIGIIKELMERKAISCYFCGFQELLENIKHSYDPAVETTSLEIQRPVFDSEVVVLDDLGAVIPSGWVKDTISLVLNRRYEGNLTTIITANFQDGPPAGVDASERMEARAWRANREQTLGDRIGERMRDRVHEMCRLISLWDVPSFRDHNPRAATR